MEKEQEKKKLELINEIEIIKSRLETGFHFPISVSDSEGNKVFPTSAKPSYPFLENNEYAVHNPLLYGLFTLDTDNKDAFPSDFIKYYGEGFNKGLKYLENENISIDQLDDINKNRNILIRLKRILHERKIKNDKTILPLVFDTLPLIWTDKNIREYGEYNGIITAIDRLAERAGLNEKDLGKETVIVEDSKEKENSESKDKIEPKTYTTHWFISGLKFADGTMDKYWNDRQDGIKEPYSAPDIAKDVGLLKAEKYILAVFKNYKNDKNLFNNPDKIKTILDYCEDNNIEVSETFKKKQAKKMNEYK